MGGLDPRLAAKFREIEKDNLRLQGEVKALREQTNQGSGNAVQRKIRGMLKISTLGGNIAHKELYFLKKNNPPSQGVSPNLSAERLFGKPKKMRLF